MDSFYEVGGNLRAHLEVALQQIEFCMAHYPEEGSSEPQRECIVLAQLEVAVVQAELAKLMKRLKIEVAEIAAITAKMAQEALLPAEVDLGQLAGAVENG